MATNVSAASYSGVTLAAESIAATFGTGLSDTIKSADTLPLPEFLDGTTVTVRDSTGTERLAPLFYISPEQVNWQIPAGTAAGAATVTITSTLDGISVSSLQIASVSPSLFAANASGQGVAAALILHVKTDGTQVYDPVARFDATQNRFVPIPIDISPVDEQVFLILFGTGFRYRSSLSSLSVSVGGIDAPVTYAGPQGDLVGLDQLNVRLPRQLIGRGDSSVTFRADGVTANPVLINIR
jgi:uncharacterized protein (TIGR03437 family)